ncbi:MAG: hypothetical protein JWN86_920 [Planctomycetota bacterium]|nr:hypothetical protein [Planctomycetota bacterium]
MGLFSFGRRRETFLTLITLEGPGRLRINGLRAKDEKSKKVAIAHERTVCWVEFSSAGAMLDKGLGRASGQATEVDRLLRDLPTMPTCRGVLDRLREGQESVGKWLQLGEPASR